MSVHPTMAKTPRYERPTAEQVRKLFDYDPERGLFTRLTLAGGWGAGILAGSSNRGYIFLNIDGRSYPAHRIAWLHHYGTWPEGEIDHINRSKSDNRIANLRDVSSCVNRLNQLDARKDSQVGLRGVSKKRSKFQARIMVDGKPVVLGVFGTATEAHAAYVAAKRELHAGAFV